MSVLRTIGPLVVIFPTLKKWGGLYMCDGVGMCTGWGGVISYSLAVPVLLFTEFTLFC